MKRALAGLAILTATLATACVPLASADGGPRCPGSSWLGPVEVPSNVVDPSAFPWEDALDESEPRLVACAGAYGRDHWAADDDWIGAPESYDGSTPLVVENGTLYAKPDVCGPLCGVLILHVAQDPSAGEPGQRGYLYFAYFAAGVVGVTWDVCATAAASNASRCAQEGDLWHARAAVHQDVVSTAAAVETGMTRLDDEQGEDPARGVRAQIGLPAEAPAGVPVPDRLWVSAANGAEVTLDQGPPGDCRGLSLVTSTSVDVPCIAGEP